MYPKLDATLQQNMFGETSQVTFGIHPTECQNHTQMFGNGCGASTRRTRASREAAGAVRLSLCAQSRANGQPRPSPVGARVL